MTLIFALFPYQNGTRQLIEFLFYILFILQTNCFSHMIYTRYVFAQNFEFTKWENYDFLFRNKIRPFRGHFCKIKCLK